MLIACFARCVYSRRPRNHQPDQSTATHADPFSSTLGGLRSKDEAMMGSTRILTPGRTTARANDPTRVCLKDAQRERRPMDEQTSRGTSSMHCSLSLACGMVVRHADGARLTFSSLCPVRMDHVVIQRCHSGSIFNSAGPASLYRGHTIISVHIYKSRWTFPPPSVVCRNAMRSNAIMIIINSKRSESIPSPAVFSVPLVWVMSKVPHI